MRSSARVLRTGFPWASGRQPKVIISLHARCLPHSSRALRGTRFGPAVVGRVILSVGSKKHGACPLGLVCTPGLLGLSWCGVCLRPGVHAPAWSNRVRSTHPAACHAALTGHRFDSRSANLPWCGNSPAPRQTGYTLATRRPPRAAARATTYKQAKPARLRRAGDEKQSLETPISFTMINYGEKRQPN